MLTSIPNFFPILLTTEFVLGILVNGFIVLVNCIDCIKRHKISLVDRILTGLAFSRIALLCVIIINLYATCFDSTFYGFEVHILVNIAWTASNHFSIWFATNLNIFYFLKIANFSHFLFLYLKRRLNSVLLVMILGTLVFLFTHLSVINIDENMLKNGYKGNITWETKLKNIARLSNMTIFTLTNFISFAMSLMSFALLIISLGKHLKKMQLNAKGAQDPSTKVHTRALQTMISYFVLFAVYTLALIISVWISNRLQNKPAVLFCQAILSLYPSNHSFFLIWGNKKLKEAFLSFLGQLGCWEKERK
ncbi:putative taste receptor type 2 member 33 [Erinaceus europaeus]|uniref:Taste receptor type 2 n=1 Tax=Erinaceus europaeus TaxID=9365 RepID=A0A1S2Z9D2_ERIEU|nr:putative taste receptor type 2 member 33 [Erinaceus europaeus]